MAASTVKKWERHTPNGKKLPEHVGDKGAKKTAGLDPRQVFANAFKGALGGAIAGSRRSIDDKTLEGIAQGAAIGAVGGVIAGEAMPKSRGAAVVGGGLAGYIGSRGPRGPSRPDLHLRMDRGDDDVPAKTAADDSGKKKIGLAASAGIGAGVGAAMLAHRLTPGMRAAAAKANGGSKVIDMVQDAGSGAWRAAHQFGKHASMADIATHAAEVAGLGILAAPSVAEMNGKRVSNKTKHRTEVAGLGVLAVPSAVHLLHAGYGKAKGLAARVLRKEAK